MTLTRELRTSVALVLAILLALTAFILGNQPRAQAAGLGSFITHCIVFPIVDSALDTSLTEGGACPSGSVPPATLTVVEEVVNTGGGSAQAGDFTIHVAGTNLSSSSFAGSASGTVVALDPGSYSVSETGPTGYDTGYSAECSGVFVLSDKTCTITNTFHIVAGGGGDGTTTATSTDTGGTATTTDIGGTSASGDAGSSGTGSSHHRPPGSVSTTTEGEVLGASADCPMYLTGYIRQGAQNDAGEVAKLQTFLNTYEASSLQVSGVYDAPTLAAVNAFQLKYAADVLLPWGLTNATGRVYYTTQKQINSIYCKFGQDFPLSAAQLQEVARMRAMQHSLRTQSSTSVSAVQTTHATMSASRPAPAIGGQQSTTRFRIKTAAAARRAHGRRRLLRRHKQTQARAPGGSTRLCAGSSADNRT